jgi:hypothetical protein
VKVHCTEGIANHSGPESCAGVRKDGGEALTGVCIGQPLSRENGLQFRAPTRSLTWKAIRRGTHHRQCLFGSAWSETLACADAPCTGTGRSWDLAGEAPPVRIGKVRSQSR